MIQRLSMLTQHGDPLMQNYLSPPPSGTIRSKNKQAPRTKIGSSQELAARLWLNRGKQAERRESRETETACTGPEQILLLP